MTKEKQMTKESVASRPLVIVGIITLLLILLGVGVQLYMNYDSINYGYTGPDYLTEDTLYDDAQKDLDDAANQADDALVDSEQEQDLKPETETENAQ